MGRHKSEQLIDVSRRRAYEALAQLAAKRCGLAPATAEAAAENDQAREVRDCLWAELQRRVADVHTYSVDNLHQWLTREMGVEVGRGSVQRLREHNNAVERAIKLRAERAQQVIEAAGAGCEDDVLEATRVLAAQAMFNALQGLDENALTDMKPGQVLKMFDSVSIMSRQAMETRYRKAQLGELVKKFDREAKAKVKGANGVLNAEDLAEIRKAVFGETA